MVTVISTIFVFGLLIFFHELGHFLVAKKVGVKVHEFSLGFGPVIFGFKRRETVYNLRIVPLGGFVSMAGMNPGKKDLEEGEEHRGFSAKSIKQRMAVISAGSLMNFFLAVLLLAVAAFLYGIPAPTTTIKDAIMPASEYIQPGDKIIAIDNQETKTWSELNVAITNKPNQDILVTVLRDNNEHQYNITTTTNELGYGKLGIMPVSEISSRNLIQSVTLGFTLTFDLIVTMYKLLYGTIAGLYPADIYGPVGIAGEIGNAANEGIIPLLQIAALLSINLGIINLLPFPALDGSRLMFMLIEAVRRKPLDLAKENLVHVTGFCLLMLLMILVTYKDIIRILGAI